MVHKTSPKAPGRVQTETLPEPVVEHFSVRQSSIKMRICSQNGNRQKLFEIPSGEVRNGNPTLLLEHPNKRL